jgi:MFS transporter, MHS family, proline/betaine transporter
VYSRHFCADADGFYCGALPAMLVEAAPPMVRCTAVALGYNLCYGLFGGLSPLALVERSGNEIAPAFLIWRLPL